MHISLYMALLHEWARLDCPPSIGVSARLLMPRARIGGTNLYHRTIRQLHAYGYIVYEPSFDAEKGSRVRFIE